MYWVQLVVENFELHWKLKLLEGKGLNAKSNFAFFKFSRYPKYFKVYVGVPWPTTNHHTPRYMLLPNPTSGAERHNPVFVW